MSIPFGEELFLDGFRVGCLAAVVAVVVGAISRAIFKRPAPVGGLLLAAAACLGLRVSYDLDPEVYVAIALLGAAGFVGDLIGRWWPVTLLPAAVAAGILVDDAPFVPDVRWIEAVVLVAPVVVGGLLAAFDRRWAERGFTLPLLAITVTGVYYTVPDTELVLPVLGAALPMALASWPWPVVGVGVGGAFSSVGVIAWTASAGGTGRHSAVVGAVASFGLLAAEPVGRALVRGRSAFAGGGRWALLPVAGAHLAVVYVGSRVAGLRPTAGQAAVIAAMLMVVSVAAVAVAARRLDRQPTPADVSA